MTIQQHWKQEYHVLRDFIAANPGIIITKNEVSIPKVVRDEFYRRFDDIRRMVVQNHYSDLPSEIETLCEQYRAIDSEIKELLNLDDILMPIDLLSFLRDPQEGLTRSVYNRLFDLVQGKIGEEEFALMTKEDIGFAATQLFHMGYERWAALTLIKQLNPDEAYFVDFDVNEKLMLKELKSICFGYQAHHPTMRLPEFVIHSNTLEKYIAVKAPLVREIETYLVPFKPRVRPKKNTGDTSNVLDSRVLFLYFMATKDDIPLIADIYEGTRTSPDWIVECMSGDELTHPEFQNRVQYHTEVMNPKGGTAVVLVDSCRETEIEPVPDYVYTVSAGIDRSKLQSLIDGCFLHKQV